MATILELPLDAVPSLVPGQDPATGWVMSRWLGGMGLGLVPIADPASFAWPGPWLARVSRPDRGERGCVVMFGVPSGVVWDPAGITGQAGWEIADGFVIAAADVALARPPSVPRPEKTGTVEGIWVASAAGQTARSLEGVIAIAGEGLEGDRHVAGTGTFPSGLPGSALTLIEAEVCESFEPPLEATVHRRNLVTRGITLNGLVGRAFTVGDVRCRGMRLCEPCKVVAGYAGKPIIRPLVHRGGLRADIVEGGTIHIGDHVVPD